jgi:hypothetical protein
MDVHYSAVIRLFADLRADWQWHCSGGRGALPARAKRALLRRYARDFGLHTLVETGTYLGDTVAALRHDFRRIYSIELSPALALRAKKRFQALPHVTILQGDSATVLPSLLADVFEPTLFWLDGHYSGGVTAHGGIATPIVEEVEAILAHPMQGHVLLIDDAHWLQTELSVGGVDDLVSNIRSARPAWMVELRDDVIRAHAGRA